MDRGCFQHGTMAWGELVPGSGVVRPRTGGFLLWQPEACTPCSKRLGTVVLSDACERPFAMVMYLTMLPLAAATAMVLVLVHNMMGCNGMGWGARMQFQLNADCLL